MSGLSNHPQTIAKTIKLFIGGEFPRTESGRSYPVYYHGKKNIYAHLCQASRKDLRNAVTAAQSAQVGWANKSAYNRGQILYRMAEMLEARKSEFSQIFKDVFGYSPKQSENILNQAVDQFVYYAGWSDKYQQVIGSVNPVSGPHHNFTTPEATGTVALVMSEELDFVKLVACISSIIVSGNALVVFIPDQAAIVLSALSEVLTTSDLPKGVVNILSGFIHELKTHFASHMEIQAISCQHPLSKAEADILSSMKFSGSENMKRIAGPIQDFQSLENILQFVEYKTVWHPVGN